MESLLRDKFRRNKDLQEKLLKTDNLELINTLNEVSSENIYFGVIAGNGQNQLGKLLEQIRFDIKSHIDIDRWIHTSFALQTDPQLIPQISFKVYKENQLVENLILKQKALQVMGSLMENDVYMAHISISRIHSVILVEKNLGICIIDLGSKGGTFVNNNIIQQYWPVALKSDDNLNFAFSTRNYILEIKQNNEKFQQQELIKDNQTVKKPKQQIYETQLDDQLVIQEFHYGNSSDENKKDQKYQQSTKKERSQRRSYENKRRSSVSNNKSKYQHYNYHKNKDYHFNRNYHSSVRRSRSRDRRHSNRHARSHSYDRYYNSRINRNYSQYRKYWHKKTNYYYYNLHENREDVRQGRYRQMNKRREGNRRFEKKFIFKRIEKLKEKIKENNLLKELQKKKELLKAKIIEKQNSKKIIYI